MIIKIDKTEIEALKKVCALANAYVFFYTIEPNDLMVQAEISEMDGREIQPKDAWYICSSFRMEVQIEEIIKPK